MSKLMIIAIEIFYPLSKKITKLIDIELCKNINSSIACFTQSPSTTTFPRNSMVPKIRHIGDIVVR